MVGDLYHSYHASPFRLYSTVSIYSTLLLLLTWWHYLLLKVFPKSHHNSIFIRTNHHHHHYSIFIIFFTAPSLLETLIIIITTHLSFSSLLYYRYVAFHFAHVVIVFVGITFLVKSVIFISLALSRKKTLLHYDNHSSQTLLMEFISLSVDGGGTVRWGSIISSCIHLYYSYLLFISTIHHYYPSLLFISTIHLYYCHYQSSLSISTTTIYPYYPSNLFLTPHIRSEKVHFRLRSHRNSISRATRENWIQDSSRILHPEL